MKENPFVSIIILNYNCEQYLKSCVESVLCSNYPNFEIIVVDNNSKDQSVSILKKTIVDKRLRILELHENLGFSVGNNIGAKAADYRSDYLVLLNPDTCVDSDWLTYLTAELENNSSVGVAQAKLLLMNTNRIDSAGGFINHYGIAFSRGHNEKENGQYDNSINIFYAKGAALIIRRKTWLKLGGLDPLFFAYYEETDLCWRTLSLGYRVILVPKAIVFHAGASILRKVPYFVKFNESKGRLILLSKNYSTTSFFRYVPLTFILELINCIRFSVIGDYNGTTGTLQGSIWCLSNFRKIWSIRRTKNSSQKSVNAMMTKRLF